MELYERYHRPLYQAAYPILKNREDAQDAMQEGMIKKSSKSKLQVQEMSWSEIRNV